MGDINGDGFIDLGVGAPDDEDGVSEGSVFLLFLRGNDTVRRFDRIATTVSSGYFYSGSPGEPPGIYRDFGSSMAVAALPYHSGGERGLIVGAPGNGLNAPDGGGVFVTSLDANGTVIDGQQVSNLRGGIGYTAFRSSERFGTDVSTIGDTTGSGVEDLLVGAPGHDLDRDLDGKSGAVYYLQMSAGGTVESFRVLSERNYAVSLIVTLDGNFGQSVGVYRKEESSDLQSTSVWFAVGSPLKSSNQGEVNLFKLNVSRVSSPSSLPTPTQSPSNSPSPIVSSSSSSSSAPTV